MSNGNCFKVWCQTSVSPLRLGRNTKTLDMHIHFCGFSFIHSILYFFSTWVVIWLILVFEKNGPTLKCTPKYQDIVRVSLSKLPPHPTSNGAVTEICDFSMLGRTLINSHWAHTTIMLVECFNFKVSLAYIVDWTHCIIISYLTVLKTYFQMKPLCNDLLCSVAPQPWVMDKLFAHTQSSNCFDKPCSVYLAWEIGIVTKFLVAVPARFQWNPLIFCSIALVDFRPFNAQWLCEIL